METASLEQLIKEMVNVYGSALWLGFVTMIITAFALLTIKNLVSDLVYYMRARASDIGFGQRIYHDNQIYIVRTIKFKYIIIYDDKKIIRIPIKNYMDGTIVFPVPRYDDFDEKKYHEGPWDRRTERRQRNALDD